MNKLTIRPHSELSADLVEKAQELAQNSKATNTKRAYNSDWQNFTGWCHENGLDSFPATQDTIIGYITHLHELRRKVSTIARHLVSIAQWHYRLSGGEFDKYNVPTGRQAVKDVLAGIRRSQEKPITKKKPITPEHITKWTYSLTDSVKDVRDKAIILVGFSTGMRRSELAALKVSDLEFTDNGLTIHIRKSKTDQEGAGQAVYINYIKSPRCPVKSLLEWMERAEIEGGPVFRSLDRHGNVKDKAITPKVVALVVKRMISELGMDHKAYSAHSLRAGMITTAAENEAPIYLIKAQSRHKSDRILDGYIRPQQLKNKNVTNHLDL
jgi:site-specific recombinase XerD